jgi:hypothetical protein
MRQSGSRQSSLGRRVTSDVVDAFTEPLPPLRSGQEHAEYVELRMRFAGNPGLPDLGCVVNGCPMGAEGFRDSGEGQ